MTAIAVIATKYGVSSVIGALTGERTLGELAAELVSALSASEDRLGERLAGIEGRLDEVLEQRFTTAVGTGLRTLLDAGTTTDPHERADELRRARDQFRAAGASARSPLQVAVAERYLALCAIALGRPDAARTALGRLNGAAFEAMLDTARVRLEQRSGRQRKQADSVEQAAGEAGELAGHLLREAGVLAEGLGDGPLPNLGKAPGVDLWSISPREAPARFGPFTVTWHDVRFNAGAARASRTRFPVTERIRVVGVDGTESWLPLPAGSQLGNRLPDPTGTLDVDVTISADPVLSRPVDLSLVTNNSGSPAGTLPAGERELRLRRAIPAGQPSRCTLNVAGVLLFRSSLTG